jgi:hypothetical protein
MEATDHGSWGICGVGSRYQTTGEGTADWEDLVRAVVNSSVRIGNNAVVNCSYDLQESNKSNYKSKPLL